MELRGKAIWCWETTVVENGSENIVDVCKSLGIKHLFILVKGTSGTIVKETIAEILSMSFCPVFLTLFRISIASFRHVAIGFSRNTCFPALRASILCSLCRWGGVPMITASTSLSSMTLEKSVYTLGTLYSSAASLARSSIISQTATTSALSIL